MNYSIKDKAKFHTGDLIQHKTSYLSVGIIMAVYTDSDGQWVHVYWSDITMFSDDNVNDICHFDAGM